MRRSRGSAAEVVPAWLMRNPVVTAASGGPRAVELRQNLNALFLILSDEALASVTAAPTHIASR